MREMASLNHLINILCVLAKCYSLILDGSDLKSRLGRKSFFSLQEVSSIFRVKSSLVFFNDL